MSGASTSGSNAYGRLSGSAAAIRNCCLMSRRHLGPWRRESLRRTWCRLGCPALPCHGADHARHEVMQVCHGAMGNAHSFPIGICGPHHLTTTEERSEGASSSSCRSFSAHIFCLLMDRQRVRPAMGDLLTSDPHLPEMTH